MRDVRNATSYLYGMETCEQRETVHIVAPDGQLVWQGRSRSSLEQAGPEINRLLARANGPLHGLDIPAPVRGMLLKELRFGQLGNLEAIALKLSRRAVSRDLGEALLARIREDKRKRLDAMEALRKQGDVAGWWAEMQAFLDAFPRSREARDLEGIKREFMRDPATRDEAFAAEAFFKIVEMLGSGKSPAVKAAVQQIRVLSGKYGRTHYGRLLKELWLDHNNRTLDL